MISPDKAMEMQGQKRLLLVEDNPLFAEQIIAAIDQPLSRWGVHLVREGMRALQLIEQNNERFDLALVDIGLPDISGIEVITSLTRVVVL